MRRTATLPRSRFGCTVCREKHRKCDEQRPSCGSCQQRGLECTYETVLRWSNPNGIKSFGKAYRKSKARVVKEPGDVKSQPASPTSLSNDHPESHHVNQYMTTTAKPRLFIDAETQTGDDASGLQLKFPAEPSFGAELRANPYVSPATSALFPTSGLISASSGPSRLSSINNSRSHNTKVDEVHENKPKPFAESSDTHALYSTESPFHIASGFHEISSPSGFSPWALKNTLHSLICQIFDDSGEEAAFTYFFKHVCNVIPAHDSPQNPYRKLAIVALSYPVLLHGILAVSTAYMYNHGESHEDVVSLRQSRALSSLRMALNALQAEESKLTPDLNGLDGARNGSSVFSILNAKEIVLAAVTMQTCSVLMSGIGVFEDHVKCALHLIQDLGLFYNAPSTMFMWLLLYRFATVDVLLALLRFRKPIAPLDFFMYQANEYLDNAEPSFREMMGLSQRVLCFLAQVSVLAVELTEGDGSTAKVHAKAHSLETEMRIWGQNYYNKMLQSLDSNLPNALPSPSPQGSVDAHTALDIVCEAHYWIAQLLLMRRVLLDSTGSIRVQMIRKYLFQLLDRLPVGCGPDSCVSFPFYLAAREAVTTEDQDWVRRKHADLANIYRHRSRLVAMEVVEEIWKRSGSLEDRGAGNTPLWTTDKEVYIREMDKGASYFIF